MFKQGYQHVRGRLNTESENLFYEKTFYCLKSFEKRIQVPEIIPLGRAKMIVRLVFEENPSFFQFSPYKLGYLQNNRGCFIDFCYHYDKAKYNKYEIMIKKQIIDFIQQSHILTMDPYDQILAIYDLISNRGNYNPDVKFKRNQGTIEDYNIVGLFLNKEAVCYGFAQVFKLLCDEVGIPCMIIRGKICNRLQEVHAWNLVEYKKKFYHIDVTTACNKNKKMGRYRYFMVDANWIGKSRIIDSEMLIPEISC